MVYTLELYKEVFGCIFILSQVDSLLEVLSNTRRPKCLQTYPSRTALLPVQTLYHFPLPCLPELSGADLHPCTGCISGTYNCRKGKGPEHSQQFQSSKICPEHYHGTGCLCKGAKNNCWGKHRNIAFVWLVFLFCFVFFFNKIWGKKKPKNKPKNNSTET